MLVYSFRSPRKWFFKKASMKQKWLTAVLRKPKRSTWILSKGYIVALDGDHAIQNLQTRPLLVIIYKQKIGIVLSSFALVPAFEVVSHFILMKMNLDHFAR